MFNKLYVTINSLGLPAAQGSSKAINPTFREPFPPSSSGYWYHSWKRWSFSPFNYL